MIAENRLGKLCGIREVRNCDYFTGRPAWFLDRKLAGGGILMNFGAHTMDKVFYTTGLKVKDVFASGNNFLNDNSVEAIAQLLVTFEGGVSGTFCYCGCKGAREYRTDFYFTGGTAQIAVGGESKQQDTGNNGHENPQPPIRGTAGSGRKSVFVLFLVGHGLRSNFLHFILNAC
jgi:predicted dehydrogenase